MSRKVGNQIAILSPKESALRAIFNLDRKRLSRKCKTGPLPWFYRVFVSRRHDRGSCSSPLQTLKNMVN